MTTAQIIEAEFQRRVDLIENKEFRFKMSLLAQEIGISAREWNENKISILMTFANEACKIEDSLKLS